MPDKTPVNITDQAKVSEGCHQEICDNRRSGDQEHRADRYEKIGQEDGDQSADDTFAKGDIQLDVTPGCQAGIVKAGGGYLTEQAGVSTRECKRVHIDLFL